MLGHILRPLITLWVGLAAQDALAAVRVVATIPDLATIAREVGGNHVRVTAMALPTQDPHFVDAKPSLAVDLSRADLLLLAGLELEIGWLPTLLTASRNADIQNGAAGYLDCSQFVTVLDVPTGAVDRSMGDLHSGGNPHYFYDPRAMVDVARGVSERLSVVDPEHAADYAAGAEAFAASVEASREGWERLLAPLSGVNVIGYHRSWSYLADWLGFEVVGEIEPKPGIPPAPAHIAHVVRTAEQREVRVVLIEAFYPDTTARLVADEGGATLVRLPAETNFHQGQSYVEHIDEWVDAIAKALEAE